MIKSFHVPFADVLVSVPVSTFISGVLVRIEAANLWILFLD